MPISIKYKLVFIHVPKTGGTSIEEFFRSDGGLLFYSVPYKINGHSLQHCSYKELKEINMIPDGYRIFSVIRHPYERFLSDYNYYRTHQLFEGDILSFAIDYFSNFEKYDNHNRSILYFLNIEGKLQEEIEIIKIENLEKELMEKFGINLNSRRNVSKKFETILTQEVKDIVYMHWKEDFETFNYSV